MDPVIGWDPMRASAIERLDILEHAAPPIIGLYGNPVTRRSEKSGFSPCQSTGSSSLGSSELQPLVVVLTAKQLAESRRDVPGLHKPGGAGGNQMLPGFAASHALAYVCCAQSLLRGRAYPQDFGLEPQLLEQLQFAPSPLIIDGQKKGCLQGQVVLVEFRQVDREGNDGENLLRQTGFGEQPGGSACSAQNR